MKYYKDRAPVLFGDSEVKIKQIEVALNQLWSKIQDIQSVIEKISASSSVVLNGINGIRFEWSDGTLKIQVYIDGAWQTVIEGGL